MRLVPSGAVGGWKEIPTGLTPYIAETPVEPNRIPESNPLIISSEEMEAIRKGQEQLALIRKVELMRILGGWR